MIRVHHSSIVLALVWLMFVADSANTLLLNTDLPFWRVSIVVRLLVQIYFFFLLVRVNKHTSFLLTILILYSIFLLGSLASLNVFDSYNFIGNFSIINKMFFVFLCLEVFRNYFQTEQRRKLLFSSYEAIVLIQVISVIVGFAFQVNFLASYPDRERFGYKGFIPALNEVSGFFLIAFFYYLWKITCGKQAIAKLIATTVAGLLTGAKVALVLPVIILLYMVKWLISGRLRKAYLWFSISMCLLVAIVVIWGDYLIDRLLPSVNYFRGLWLQGRTVSSLFASGRDLKINHFISEILPNLNFMNYLFGGFDLTTYVTETDVIDIFNRLGLIGGFFFYFLYMRTLLGNIKAIPFTRLLFVGVWLGVSTVAGHLAFSAINGAYLAILLLAFSHFHMKNIYPHTHKPTIYQPIYPQLSLSIIHETQK